MTLIGVTGHRILPPENLALVAAIDQALFEIQRYFPAQSYSILSSLAEGADRLIVIRAFELLSAGLIVPLPMPVLEYARDFKTESSRLEFEKLLSYADEVVEIPPMGSRVAGYLTAGIYVLDHCNVLLTLWDGLPARGIGGTGQIVEQARLIGKPIAWIKIDPTSEFPIAAPEIRYERFPFSSDEESGNETEPR